MASNGRVGLRSGSPSFLVVGLSLVIIVLLYSYWSVSSRNSMLLRDQSFLQDRLRSLTSQKLAAEKKKSSAMAQIASIEKTRRQLEGNVESSSKEKSELNSKIQALELNLEKEKKKAATVQSQQTKSKTELQKLKGEIDQTSEKLKELTKKANSFVEMYKGVKETLAKKNDELFKVQNDWNVCTVQLKKLKEEHPAPGGNEDDKKKLELPKEKSNSVFKQGIAHLKKKMQHKAAQLATQLTTNTGPGSQTLKTVLTQVANNATSQTNTPTGKVTSGNQSGNDTNKATSPNNATTTPTKTGSTNTTTINILNEPVENKHNTTKPTKNEAGVESDEDSPDNKHFKTHKDTESESEDKHAEDEDINDNAPVGVRARPLGLKYPKRAGSDRERRRQR